MKNSTSETVEKELLSTIEKTLDKKVWTWKKVGLGVVIFLLPFGPLALTIYIASKHFQEKNK